MRRLATLAITLAAATSALATSLNGTLTVDNSFTAYISLDDAVLGVPIATGSNWSSPVSFSTLLAPGVTHYLHIVGNNTGGPAMFIGSFTLSDANAFFDNGTQSLVTNTTEWQGNLTGFGNAYSAPTDLGGQGTSPWGSFGSIDSSARFIWMNPNQAADEPNYFTVAIHAVPEPATMAALGVGALALAARARKRRRA